MYYIWSHEHGAWWRANKRGYVTDLRKAGQYSATEARGIITRANAGLAIGRENEVAVPVAAFTLAPVHTASA